MNKSFIYLFLFASCKFYSCKNKSDSLIDKLTKQENKLNLDTTKKHTAKEDFSDIYFPSPQLFIGQKLTINHKTYGCFNFFDDTITITREKDGYTVFYQKRSKSDNTYSTAKLKFDSSYYSTLNSFSLACKRIIKDKRKDTLNNEETYSFGTIKKLTINGGLHQVELFIENDNIFYNLLKPFTKY